MRGFFYALYLGIAQLVVFLLLPLSMDKNRLVWYIDKNLSIREIVKEEGLSFSTIRYWLKKYDLSTNKRQYNKLEYSCACGETDPSAFYGHKKRICGKCHNTYTVKKHREAKLFIIEYLGGSCLKCGYNKCEASLDVHHTDPLKKSPKFRTLKHRSKENIIKELQHCILLCKNCHGEEHYLQ